MKKFFKVLGYIVVILLIFISGALIYIKTLLPDVGPAAALHFKYSSERIERGKYLANNVTVCMDCHSKRDWSKFAGPLVEGTLGMGGERFDRGVGFPGVYYSKNITPAGINRYSDGELFRLITTGVTKEGRAMFPVMPYRHYGKMDPEDIYSIIAYIRSLSPIENPVPESVSDFPMSLIINTIPAKSNPEKIPAKSDQLAYGSYLINACSCVECHTRVDKGKIIPDFAFSGGREFLFQDGSVVRSSNITGDLKTGIGSWTEEMFIRKFKSFSDSSYIPATIHPSDFNSYMPWNMYGRMTTQDLAAIYNYLKTVKTINYNVQKFTPSKKI
jgi:Cytochrome c